MKRIKDMSKTQKKIEPEEVAKELGAEKLKNPWLIRFLRFLKKGLGK